MDKGGYHPVHTPVLSGDLLPGSRSDVSLVSRLVLDPALPLQSASPPGGAAMQGVPMTATSRDRGASLPPGAVPEIWSNVYCTTCLRTRRFYDRPTHLVCETCQKRLDKVAPLRRTAG